MESISNGASFELRRILEDSKDYRVRNPDCVEDKKRQGQATDEEIARDAAFEYERETLVRLHGRRFNHDKLVETILAAIKKAKE